MKRTIFHSKTLVLVLGTIFSVLELTVKCNEMDATENVDLGEVVQYVDGDFIIAVFLPITGHDNNMKCNNAFIYPSMAEQVNIFLDKINKNDSILPGIKLGAMVINSCSSEVHALKKLFVDVLRPFVMGFECNMSHCPEGKRILAGVVGGARSGVSIDMARVLQIFEISQVSYWSTSTKLSDKTLYKYFFRTVPPDNFQAVAMAEFVSQRGWNYVSILYSDTDYGIKGYQELELSLKEYNICTAFSWPIADTDSDGDLLDTIERVLEHDRAKVVILFTHQGITARLLSITSGVKKVRNISWLASDGWTALVPQDLTDSSYISNLHGTVGFSLKFPPSNDTTNHIRNLTIQDYKDENSLLNPWWQEFLKTTKNCSTTEGSGKRMCDEDERIPDFVAPKNDLDEAMYVFALALDRYHQDTCPDEPGLCKKLARRAGTEEVARDLFPYIKNVTFRSQGRTFFFDEEQNGPPLYDLFAFDQEKSQPDNVLMGWYEVGTYDHETNITLTANLPQKTTDLRSICSEECDVGYAKILSDEDCCWVCQKCTNREYASLNACIPCEKEDMPDPNSTKCIPIPVQEMRYGSSHSIACLCVGIFGLICTAIVTGIYWKKRDTAIVRASGRELCFLVLFGIALTLLNCFTITSHPSDMMCGVTRGILAIGPTVMYAGLLMKTFRVVFIFQSKGILSTRTKGYLEPLPLIFLTICVVLVQVVVLVVWLILNSPSVYVSYADNGREAFRTCKYILNEQIFVGLAYPFLIIIVCTLLATLNRNVPTGFRETMFVGFTMYTTCVTWIGFQALFFTKVDENEVERQLTTLSCALSISAITVLMCLFGPRCYTIFRHPELNTAQVVMSRHSNGANVERVAPPEPVPTLSGVLNQAYSTTNK